MIDSPADILATWLVDELHGVNPEVDSTSDWPVYVNHLPDAPGIKDRALAIYNTAGTAEGRIQRTGETIEHPGFQVRIRARVEDNGYAKARSIAEALDAMPARTQVMIDDRLYQVHSANRGVILSIGPEDDNRRRLNYTINGITTISPLENTLIGQVIWLDASIASMVDADPVGLWTNQSGEDFTQTTNDYKPSYDLAIQNGLNVVSFDGSNDYMEAIETDWEVDDYSMFFVAKATSGYSLVGVQANVHPTYRSGIFFATQAGVQFKVTTAINDTTVHDFDTFVAVDTNWHLFSIIKSVQDIKLYMDGSLIGQTSAAPSSIHYNSYARSSIGAAHNESPGSDVYTAFRQSGYGEIRFFTEAKDDAIRNIIENQLLTKWGIS